MLAAKREGNMGGCMSSNANVTEQKKRSQAIDKDLEADSKRLRRECKILLLGRQHSTHEEMALVDS